MSIRIVQLGTPRSANEGTRIGAVRRPPRGVAKTEFAAQNWYDVWFPNLAPSAELMRIGQDADTPAKWSAFVKKFKAELNEPSSKHDLNLLAALSQNSNFSIGCYCENEASCHRSVLRELLLDAGAKFA